MEKEYIITVRNTYLVTADVGEDNSTPSKKNYNEYIEFKIANVLIRIFFPIRLFIKLFIFLDKKFPRLFEYPKRSLKHIDNIMNFIYPLAIYVLRVFYLYLFLRGMIMVDQSISLLFSLVSFYLTLFLLKKFKWYDTRNTILLSVLFGGVSFRLLKYINISLPSQLKFLYLNNLGNTITYVCLLMTIWDLSKSKFDKKNY